MSIRLGFECLAYMSQRLSVSFCNHWMFIRRVVSRHHLLQKTSPGPMVRFEPNMTIFHV